VKRFLIFLYLVFFSFSLFAADFSESYTKFSETSFSEAGRVEFLQNLEHYETQIDFVLEVNRNPELKEKLQKIETICQGELSQSDIVQLQNYCIDFLFEQKKVNMASQKSLVSASIIFVLFLVVFIILAMRLLRKENELSKIQKERELQIAVQNAAVKIQEAERNQLYRKLHDTVSQDIKAEQLFTQKLEDYLKITGDSKMYLESIKQIQDNNLQNIRKILTNYSSLNSGNIPFSEALISWCANFKNSTQLETAVIINDERIFNSFSDDVKNHIFNIVKEALNNTLRHANANNVSVIFRKDANTGKNTLLICDDGTGFNPEEVDTNLHHGIKIINSRALLMNGQCKISSDSEIGTEIKIEWE